MEDRDFFDALFQQFAKTTRAEDTYWMSEECYEGGANVFAVDKDSNRTTIGWFSAEVDADFITAIHGCLPDLVRRMHDALDEADRADKDRDEREQQLFRISLELLEAREEIKDRAESEANLVDAVTGLCDQREELLAALAESDAKLEVMRSKAGDALWKIERPM